MKDYIVTLNSFFLTEVLSSAGCAATASVLRASTTSSKRISR